MGKREDGKDDREERMELTQTKAVRLQCVDGESSQAEPKERVLSGGTGDSTEPSPHAAKGLFAWLVLCLSLALSSHRFVGPPIFAKLRSAVTGACQSYFFWSLLDLDFGGARKEHS